MKKAELLDIIDEQGYQLQEFEKENLRLREERLERDDKLLIASSRGALVEALRRENERLREQISELRERFGVEAPA